MHKQSPWSQAVLVAGRCGDARARLAWYRPGWDISSWERELWSTFSVAAAQELLWEARSNPILPLVFRRYLSPGSRVLEAGAGVGQWIVALREVGYDAVGVEISESAVLKGRATFGPIQLQVGDVRRLPFPDASFHGYVSIGVVEHFEEGPQEVLKEARRVLVPGGMLFCAVPWLSPLRRLCKQTDKTPNGWRFYQWAFTVREFEAILRGQKFRPLTWTPYAAYKTLRDRFSTIRWAGDRARAHRIRAGRQGGAVFRSVKYGFLNIAPIRYLAGHMAMFVARCDP